MTSNGDFCNALTAVENKFNDTPELMVGMIKGIASEVEDLRGYRIICLVNECRGFFRADIADFESGQVRSFSMAGRVSDASSMADQIV